jgi:hypothetical protein
MDHPLVWQSIVLAACIAIAFAALLFLIASARTGYFVARIAIRDAAKRRRARRYVA